MILKKIELHNYRQHRDLSVDFTGNLIAVVGRNGSGKSNFLGAIQFALTGEQPGFDKVDLLTWGESSGSVVLSFEHGGKEYEIARSIEKPSVTLSCGGEKVTGAAKVKEALEAVGIDKDVLKQSVFVRQTEIDSCLFTDPRERELAFQRLIGLGDAAKHNKFLTDFLSAAERPKDLSADIEAAVSAKAQQEENQRSLKSQSEEIGKSLDRLGGSWDDANRKADVLQKRIRLVEDVIAKWDAFDTVRAAFDEFCTERKEDFALSVFDTGSLESHISELNLELGRMQSVASKNRDRDDAAMRRDSARSGLEALGDLSERRAEYDRKKAELDSVKARERELGRLASLASDGNVCPLCGSVTDHNVREEIESELKAVVEHDVELSAWVSNHAGIVDACERKRRLEEDLERAERDVESLGPKQPVRPEAEIREMMSEARKRLDEAKENNARAIRFGAEFEGVKKAKDDAAGALKAAMSLLPGGGYARNQLKSAVEKMNGEITKIFDDLHAVSELRARKASLDGAISQIDASIAESGAAIERLRRLQREGAIVGDKLKVVSDVKDWFAYRNGPRAMTQSVMSMLTDETNRFLELFGAEFSVMPSDEGMGFRYSYNDGRTVSDPAPDATMLSGGQRVALAVSFRFAVYSMFAGKLGLLSLDEPTAYLDAETISRFSDMLGKIRDLASNMHLQVLLSTHEEQLRGAFDQTVEIGR